MHLSKRDCGVLESGAILILSAVHWMSAEKRRCIEWSGQLSDGRQLGSYPRPLRKTRLAGRLRSLVRALRSSG